jgi:uncharacterized DUF497 family protein
METFSGLDWDEGNLAKCQKHGVSVEEIEAVFAGEPQYSPDTVHSIVEQRYLSTGRTAAGRPLFVIFTIRERDGRRYVRPISARYMHAKEAARHGHA